MDSDACVQLEPRELRRLRERAAAAYPREACGCLLGTRAGHEVHVVRVFSGRNLRRDRPGDRFELHPRDLLRAEHAAQARGLEVVGIWHSHPDRPAIPSALDLVDAWSGWAYVIVTTGPADRAPGDVRAWRLRAGRFQEQPLSRENSPTA